jgi:hypothetical protein
LRRSVTRHSLSYVRVQATTCDSLLSGGAKRPVAAIVQSLVLKDVSVFHEQMLPAQTLLVQVMELMLESGLFEECFDFATTMKQTAQGESLLQVQCRLAIAASYLGKDGRLSRKAVLDAAQPLLQGLSANVSAKDNYVDCMTACLTVFHNLGEERQDWRNQLIDRARKKELPLLLLRSALSKRMFTAVLNGDAKFAEQLYDIGCRSFKGDPFYLMTFEVDAGNAYFAANMFAKAADCTLKACCSSSFRFDEISSRRKLLLQLKTALRRCGRQSEVSKVDQRITALISKTGGDAPVGR